MLTGHSIIYFSPEKWDGLWRNRQQLMSRFAQHNQVLFVEGQPHAKSIIRRWLQGKFRLSDLFQPSLHQLSDHLHIFRYPLWAPIFGRFDGLPRKVRQAALQKALHRLNMSEPIVWFSRPNMADLVQELPPPSLTIYHVVDEYTAYSAVTPQRRQRLEQIEKKLIDRVDMVVVVSENLYTAKSAFHPHTHLVANGVDYQAYTAALERIEMPEKLARIPAPRLGYIGLIGDKLDLGMLHLLAKENPHWSLVFLGEARAPQQADSWAALQALPNVHYLGSVSADQVPDYVKGFHVGLMPYKPNQHAENISPLKLYDYLAAGIPVAAIDIPATRDFNRYVQAATNTDDFQRAVQEALRDTSPGRHRARRAIAAQHTWEARVEQLSHLIQARMIDKTHSVAI
jgi:glycosyltransferase involved in cell wall biosynthesis